jgi:Uncharacterised nucleotidyltransferase
LGDAKEYLCRPAPLHELLLKAALLPRDEAIRAWEDWRLSADIDRLDAGSYRLLPLLYRNLRAHAIDDPAIKKLKGIYRHTWSKNQLRMRHMADTLRFFDEAGIETLILKGAPLILLYYRDHGLRPMNDVDVLIRPGCALAAVNLLRNLGWRHCDRWPRIFHESYISVGHASAFEDPDGRQFDLHWHVLPECCRTDADDDFWSAAIPTTIHGVKTSTLNSADHLLHVCVHGTRWDPIPPFRWVADAAVITASEPQLDWSRLVDAAARHRLVWPVREALGYLRDTFHIPVPNSTLEDLRSIRSSRIEYFEYRYKARNYERKMFGYLPVHWFHYLRLAGRSRSAYSVIGFARYLQRLCGARNLLQLAGYAIVRSVKRASERRERRRGVVAAG